jgi:hypothetical protein
MTHSGLHPHKIIVKDEDSLEITGIIDWKCAGVYPEYWEYWNTFDSSFLAANRENGWFLISLRRLLAGISTHMRDFASLFSIYQDQTRTEKAVR